MTNITVTCVDLAVRYRVQPRYGAMLAKMDYKAKLEEEEGRLSLHQGEPQDGGRALRVHPLMLGWSVGGIVSIDTLTRVHRLAFSLPLCCPASRAIPPRCGWSEPTSHPQEVWLVSGVARAHRPAALCGRGSRACQGRSRWSVDGQGEKRAGRGQEGGCDGVQEHRSPCTLRRRTPHTSPYAPA